MKKNTNINEYIYDKLIVLKQENPEYYNQVYNVLTFIYKDVDKEYFGNLKDKYRIEDFAQRAGNDAYRDNRAYYLERERDELFNSFVNNESGIIDCLFELLSSKDKRFQDKFFESVELPITMLREEVSFNSVPSSYIYNLYIMLYAYCVNKDNYENFAAIVDDVKHNLISENNYYRSKENYFNDKKNIVDELVAIPNYYQNPRLRNCLKQILSHFKIRFEDEEIYQYKDMFKHFKTLNNALKKAKDSGIVIDEATLQEIENDLSKYTELRHESIEMYFEEVLLFNNRYQFIKERLPKLDRNTNFKKQVSGHFANMDYSFFEYLNSLNIYDGDSFIEMMKIVFDSDSFKALFSRLGSITQASLAFKQNKKEDALQIIKELSSSKHNSRDNGIEVVLPQNNINITKPESISERMILFYQINFGLPKKPKCLQNYQNDHYRDISEFVSDLETEVEEAKRVEIAIEPVPDKAPKAKKGIFSRF